MNWQYDDLPLRGKETSDGEKTRRCHCGGRCYVFYDEAERYHVECEHGGHVIGFRATSGDMAIKIWNDMPHALISAKRCRKTDGGNKE